MCELFAMLDGAGMSEFVITVQWRTIAIMFSSTIHGGELDVKRMNSCESKMSKHIVALHNFFSWPHSSDFLASEYVCAIL